MEERRRIGIIFNFSKNWLGGIYYVVNIVKTLNFLEDDKKPEVILFYDVALKEFLHEFDYPYITKVEWRFPSLIKGYLASWFTGKNTFIDDMVGQYKLDGVYPLMNQSVDAGKYEKEGVKLVSWFADLQHKYYPGFFTKKQWWMREIRLKLMLRNTNNLVVSSHSVENDFNKFYKLKESLKISVYHFTSIIDDFKFENHSELLKKYNLPDKYFMVSNQFHKHKNHKVLLESLILLKKKKNDIHLAITGKFPSDSNSPYIVELYDLIEKNNLHDKISFLGVISRHDQLCLMRYCQAVVQPSLFEGWSTVIEDAISLQTPVIASDLEVNIEQLGDKGAFFSPHDADQLAGLLENHPVRIDFSKKLYEDYNDRVRGAAMKFIQIFD
ncbi:MAG: glycosyltransferase family 4 protein [Cyclobacteriaceae bacterium]|nr:glycosyltransferase family 4 protein [Cyclobacteriaceae bacterium]